jgi:flagellar protein FlaF
MHNQAAQAYQRNSQVTATPRDLEAGLLIRSAAQIQAVKDDWEGSGEKLEAALTFNRRLWTLLVTAATDEQNPLPAQMKTNIANIAIFIFRHTMTVLADPKPEKLTSLITINSNIAAGLRGG